MISRGGKKSRRFGHGSCSYVILADADIWREAAKKNLDKNFNAQQASFSKGIQEDITTMAKEAVAGGIFLQPVRMEFELARAEDKKQDYSDLQQAYDTAYEAYAIYKAQGYNNETIESLQRAIPVWEKALQEADLKNKKARINKKIAKALHWNIAWAAMFSNDYDKSLKHLRTHLSLNNGSGSTPLIRQTEARKTAYETNGELAESTESVNRYLEQSNTYRSNLNIVHVTKASLPPFRAAHRKRVRMARLKENLESDGAAGGDMASVEGNPYAEQMTKTAFQGYTIHVAPYIGTKMDAFPKEMCELTMLNEVSITYNDLQSLPEEIGNLTDLKVLKLNNNKIGELPSGIGNLKKLTELNLGKNRLTELPAEIGNLSGLETLNLGGNRLTTLPAELGNLENLETLNLANNQFTSLPAQLENLKNLKKLNLSNNNLSRLPEFVYRLPQLKELNLKKSGISKETAKEIKVKLPRTKVKS